MQNNYLPIQNKLYVSKRLILSYRYKMDSLTGDKQGTGFI